MWLLRLLICKTAWCATTLAKKIETTTHTWHRRVICRACTRLCLACGPVSIFLARVVVYSINSGRFFGPHSDHPCQVVDNRGRICGEVFQVSQKKKKKKVKRYNLMLGQCILSGDKVFFFFSFYWKNTAKKWPTEHNLNQSKKNRTTRKKHKKR